MPILFNRYNQSSENVLFPGHNHLLTTGADDPSLIITWSPARVIINVKGNHHQWLAGVYGPDIEHFLDLASMVVICWIVPFLPVNGQMLQGLCSIIPNVHIILKCFQIDILPRIHMTLSISWQIRFASELKSAIDAAIVPHNQIRSYIMSAISWEDGKIIILFW